MKLAEIKKRYTGPTLGKEDLPRLLREELMEGRIFVGSPAGKQQRYWAYDEERRVSEKIEQLLAAGPLAESKLPAAVGQAMPKVSSAPAIKQFLRKMVEERRIFRVPGKGKASFLSLKNQTRLPELRSPMAQ